MKANLTKSQYIQLAKETLSKLFSNVPFVSDTEVDSSVDPETFCDFRAKVHFCDSKTTQEFLVEVKASGEKRFAMLFCEKVQQYIKKHNDNVCFLFVAPYVSEATAEFLCKKNMSFLDLSGNCHILTKRMIFQVIGKSNQYIRKGGGKNYLSKSASAASAIIRTMLSEPHKFWKVKELSDVTGKAIGTVSNVKAFLTEREWIDDQFNSFRLKNIRELLHTWSKDYHKKGAIEREYYSLLSIPELEDSISKWSQSHDRSGVLGGFSAAARYAPTVRYNRVNVYVEEQSLFEFEKDLGLKRVESGGNVIVTIPHDETPCMFCQEINGSIVTSPAQTILDLLGMPNRGEEAADAILSKYYRRPVVCY